MSSSIRLTGKGTLKSASNQMSLTTLHQKELKTILYPRISLAACLKQIDVSQSNEEGERVSTLTDATTGISQHNRNRSTVPNELIDATVG